MQRSRPATRRRPIVVAGMRLGLMAACLALAAAVTAFAGPEVLFAHASLEAADPAAGSTIPEGPELITADFTDRLDPRLSSLTLARADGTVIATGGVASDDPEARQMVLRPPTLTDGVYTVGWTAISSDDGNAATGTYTLTIAAAAPRPSPTSSTAPLPSPAATPSATPSPATSAAAPPTGSMGTPLGAGTGGSAPPSIASPGPTASSVPGGEGSGPGAQPIVLAIVLALMAAAVIGVAVTYRRRRAGRAP